MLGLFSRNSAESRIVRARHPSAMILEASSRTCRVASYIRSGPTYLGRGRCHGSQGQAISSGFLLPPARQPPNAPPFRGRHASLAPVLVLVSIVFCCTPKVLAYPGAVVLIVLPSVLIAGQIAGDGRSDWLKWGQLLAAYLVLGIAFVSSCLLSRPLNSAVASNTQP
jgi:hypothetical protein